jgi:hypothetical protein
MSDITYVLKRFVQQMRDSVDRTHRRRSGEDELHFELMKALV